jgi:hypothetical protein
LERKFAREAARDCSMTACGVGPVSTLSRTPRAISRTSYGQIISKFRSWQHRVQSTSANCRFDQTADRRHKTDRPWPLSGARYFTSNVTSALRCDTVEKVENSAAPKISRCNHKIESFSVGGRGVHLCIVHHGSRNGRSSTLNDHADLS